MACVPSLFRFPNAWASNGNQISASPRDDQNFTEEIPSITLLPMNEPSYHMILACLCLLLQGCMDQGENSLNQSAVTPACVEECEDHTFRGNCNTLRESQGFRQNIFLYGEQRTMGLICMDLDRELYFIVDATLPVLPPNEMHPRYRNMRIGADRLRKKMDPEAFILDRPQNNLIFHIPRDAGELFPVELLRGVCGIRIKQNDIRFAWD